VINSDGIPSSESSTGRPPRSSRRSTTPAEHRWHCRDAEVELARLEADADAAVLWAAALGDVELREQLHAGDDRVVQLRGCFERRDEDTIDADARGEAGARSLEVDVGGARVVGVADEQVDVSNDRGLVGEVANVGGGVVVR
jgi:hypothetical protein